MSLHTASFGADLAVAGPVVHEALGFVDHVLGDGQLGVDQGRLDTAVGGLELGTDVEQAAGDGHSLDGDGLAVGNPFGAGGPDRRLGDAESLGRLGGYRHGDGFGGRLRRFDGDGPAGASVDRFGGLGFDRFHDDGRLQVGHF